MVSFSLITMCSDVFSLYRHSQLDLNSIIIIQCHNWWTLRRSHSEAITIHPYPTFRIGFGWFKKNRLVSTPLQQGEKDPGRAYCYDRMVALDCPLEFLQREHQVSVSPVINWRCLRPLTYIRFCRPDRWAEPICGLSDLAWRNIQR